MSTRRKDSRFVRLDGKRQKEFDEFETRPDERFDWARFRADQQLWRLFRAQDQDGAR
jgi:hypothetical protein